MDITEYVRKYPQRYAAENGIGPTWQEPLVAFADASDPLFATLKTIIDPAYMLPKDFVAGARTVVSFFIPFTRELGESNVAGTEPSVAWSQAYVDTNNMIAALKDDLCRALDSEGWRSSPANVTVPHANDDVMSLWSQRSAAYIAGLGTFGINNMLITEKGCCGRFGSIVTEMPVEPTARPDGEYCLFKKNGTCRVCIDRCPAGVFRVAPEHRIKVSGSQLELGGAAEYGVFFDRNKCNNHISNELVLSDEYPCREVCGKCDVGLPCSFCIPR